MELKIERVENAIQAATELGRDGLPWIWLKFIKSGWSIKESKECACGGKWGWFKPSLSGELNFFGCVCHNPVDSQLLLHSKNTEDARMRKLLLTLNPSNDDIGKIFCVKFGTDSGSIVSKGEFSKIDPLEVGRWKEITELDIQKELA